MADMTWHDYVAMVEDTAVRTHLIEYRYAPTDTGPGELVGCALVDVLADGLSLVYSFYDPLLARRSPGSFVILDHVVQAQAAGLPYVYLGYWVSGSEKMDYKARFAPLEVLKPGGWRLLAAVERGAR
jgi:arginine-tRNA-protein transferase